MMEVNMQDQTNKLLGEMIENLTAEDKKRLKEKLLEKLEGGITEYLNSKGWSNNYYSMAEFMKDTIRKKIEEIVNNKKKEIEAAFDKEWPELLSKTRITAAIQQWAKTLK
jgi:predicted house-cleaning noncanonical NTP pyrophosphatase (MazG superfamily)